MGEQLIFNVSHQQISRIDDFKPVKNSVNYLRAKFVFQTDEWENLTKTATFKNGDGDSYAVILENDACVVPHEVLSGDSNYIAVSVFAGDLITVNTARVFVGTSGYDPDAEYAEPPTPSVYEQILTRLQELEDYVDERVDNIDGGLFTDWNNN